MIGFGQTQKDVSFLGPVNCLTNATTTGSAVDTRGWDYCTVTFAFDSAATVSNVPLGMSVAHSADTTASNFTEITALTGGTGWTLPTAVVSSEAYRIRMNIPLDGFERYLRASVTPGTVDQIIYVGGRLEQHNTAGDNTSAATLGCLNVNYA